MDRLWLIIADCGPMDCLLFFKKRKLLRQNVIAVENAKRIPCNMTALPRENMEICSLAIRVGSGQCSRREGIHSFFVMPPPPRTKNQKKQISEIAKIARTEEKETSHGTAQKLPKTTAKKLTRKVAQVNDFIIKCVKRKTE